MSKFSDHNFAGEKALIRVDFNVPLNEKYEITDDTRMTAAVPTIKKIMDDGGMPILMSHLGRPKDGPTEKYSLKHLVPHLKKLLGGANVLFADDCIGEQAYATASKMQPEKFCCWRIFAFIKKKKKVMQSLQKNWQSWVMFG